MSELVPIEITTGKINSDQGSGKTYMFHSPTPTSLRRGDKETYLTTAIQKEARVGRKLSSSSKFGSLRGVLEAIGGAYHTQTFQLAEGEVFKVFAQANTSQGGGNWRSRMKTACMFFVPRPDAALQRINITVPQGIRGATTEVWTITGRFDILTLERAKMKGVKVLTNAQYQFNEINQNALFSVEELAPATRSEVIEKVKDVGGGKKVVKRERRRLLDLD